MSANTPALVRTILVQELGLDVAPGSLEDSTRLQEDLGIESAALLQLVLGLEDEFDIEIADNDLSIENFGCVGAIVDYVGAQVAAQ